MYFPVGRDAVTNSSVGEARAWQIPQDDRGKERRGGEAQETTPNCVCIGSGLGLAGSRKSLLRDSITESQGRGSGPAQGKTQMVSILTGQARGFKLQGLGEIRLSHQL